MREYNKQNETVFNSLKDPSISKTDKTKILEEFGNKTMLRVVVNIVISIVVAIFIFSTGPSGLNFNSNDGAVTASSAFHLIAIIAIILSAIAACAVPVSNYMKASSIMKESKSNDELLQGDS